MHVVIRIFAWLMLAVPTVLCSSWTYTQLFVCVFFTKMHVYK